MDRELLLRARAGDMEAFDLIVLAKGEPLFRTALAILGNEADARDAAQETLINAWRRLPDLREVDRFDAWLGRSLINQCRDALRRRGRGREVPVDGGAVGSPSTHRPSDLPGELLDAFARLSIDHRALLVLHHERGR